jgi:hypothetical protein
MDFWATLGQFAVEGGRKNSAREGVGRHAASGHLVGPNDSRQLVLQPSLCEMYALYVALFIGLAKDNDTSSSQFTQYYIVLL